MRHLACYIVIVIIRSFLGSIYFRSSCTVPGTDQLAMSAAPMKKPAVGMQIFIKGMIRRTIALYVEPNDTLDKGKAQIQAEVCIQQH